MLRAASGPVNQHEVSQVDKGTDALSGNEDRIPYMERVGQRDQPARETHVPEGDRHMAFRAALRGEPLHKPPHEKQTLTEEPDAQPDDLGRAHIGKRLEVRG